VVCYNSMKPEDAAHAVDMCQHAWVTPDDDVADAEVGNVGCTSGWHLCRMLLVT